MDSWNRKYFSDELRECAASLASAHTGKELRQAIAEGFILIADAVREDEIPVKRLMRSCYLRGAFIGAVLAQAIIIIGLIAGMQV